MGIEVFIEILIICVCVCVFTEVINEIWGYLVAKTKKLPFPHAPYNWVRESSSMELCYAELRNETFLFKRL